MGVASCLAMSQSRLTPLERRQRHWRGTVRLTWTLGLVWLGLIFGVPWLVSSLAPGQTPWAQVYGWTAQGALVGFWLLVLVYAWAMRQLDRRFDMLERQASDGAENAPERPGRSR